ncbi:SIS domain-containing protein [Domibacillus sp. 8LH]|uniref:SIS domain-containing protein n=2 Tax=Domibacillus TaxID=1433999 RepID=UPI00203E05C8|nr:SIS domain-containing protein [Domibacillus indicus]MCM3789395.1 SIS domain-containing protein [Domibacillus indicus]
MMYLKYVHRVADMLVDAAHKQTSQADIAAEWIVKSVRRGGIVHVFGCGHSHMLAEELFYRAGGLACIQPIFLEDVMLHKGAVRSSTFERQNGYIASLEDELDIRPEDVLIVVSTSGINPVPIDILLRGRKAGVKTIAITSLEYSRRAQTRHEEGTTLRDAADLVIDNSAPYGDALLTDKKAPAPFGPASTLLSAALLNGIMASVIAKMIERGLEPPIFLSGNLPDADEHNRMLVEQYKERIPLLR